MLRENQNKWMTNLITFYIKLTSVITAKYFFYFANEKEKNQYN